MTKRIALYVRCSTADRQTTENQIRDLRGVADQHGGTVAGVFDDDGISGGVPREERPAMQRLLRAIARREIDMVAAWAVDRLGRRLIDLLGLLGELRAKKIDLYLHQQAGTGHVDPGRPAITEDTRDTVRAALDAGESERAIARRLGIGKGTVGRVRAGLAVDRGRALSQGSSDGALPLGLPCRARRPEGGPPGAA